MNSLFLLPLFLQLIHIHITSLCVSVAQAEDGAPTKMTGTAAADAHLLDLFDSGGVGGPRVKGNHLCDSEDELRWDTRGNEEVYDES